MITKPKNSSFIDLSQAAYPEWELQKFLRSHEEDIASETNDFGELADVFKQIVGRSAQKGFTPKRVDTKRVYKYTSFSHFYESWRIL